MTRLEWMREFRLRRLIAAYGGPEDPRDPSVNDIIDSNEGQETEEGFDDMPYEAGWDDGDFDPEDDDEDEGGEFYEEDEE